MIKFKTTQNDEGRTLLKFIEKVLIDVPKSKIEKIFRNKDIKINNKRTSNKKYFIVQNDEIIIYGIKGFEFKKQKFIEYNFKIIFEDQNIIIVNKPININVHSSFDSLDKQVISYLKFIQKDSFKPSHIGRLDKVTSGIMLYAKNYKTLKEMKNKNNSFEKYYRLISNLKESTKLEAYIYHDEKNKKEYISKKYGKKCITEFKVLKNNEVEAKIFTGRKHQIRASLEYLNYPIKGDVKYGGNKDKRVFLHSYKIIFHDLENHLKYLNNKVFICEQNF